LSNKTYHTVGTVPKSNKTYHIVGTVPKSNRKNEERGKMYTLNTQMLDHALSWLVAGTSIKCNIP